MKFFKLISIIDFLKKMVINFVQSINCIIFAVK